MASTSPRTAWATSGAGGATRTCCGARREWVVIGSHLDSVPDGGAFDGPLGVVSALAAVDALRDRGFEPGRPIGVVNFVDEEGARFGVACAGSRIITGALTPTGPARSPTPTAPRWPRRWRRRAVTRDPRPRRRGRAPHRRLRRAARRAGPRPATTSPTPVALGTDIWPHGRWRIDIPGEANHAGTTRLDDRRTRCSASPTPSSQPGRMPPGPGCVATVGKVAVLPGGVNAIPSHVTAWLDARGPDERVRPRGRRRRRVGGRSALGATTPRSRGPRRRPSTPTRRRGCTRLLPDAPLLGTGAGHDAGILATHGMPSAMLFVRNPTGVSHSPDEFASADDCHHGVTALTAVVTELCTGKDPESMSDADDDLLVRECLADRRTGAPVSAS